MEKGVNFKKRLRELGEKAYRENIYVFTDFLSISELADYYESEHEFTAVGSCAWGGTEHAERKMVRFGSEESFGYVVDYPIVLLRIAPVNARFSEPLTHRDYLGSILGLGLERETTGDIFFTEGHTAYVFVKEQVADYIKEQLSYVKHTHVKVEVADALPEKAGPALVEENINVSSNRADAIIARVYNLSRDAALKLFSEGRVFVNGRSVTANARPLKEEDLVSVRGFGRFLFSGEGGNTRKNRLYVKIRKYVSGR